MRKTMHTFVAGSFQEESMTPATKVGTWELELGRGGKVRVEVTRHDIQNIHTTLSTKAAQALTYTVINQKKKFLFSDYIQTLSAEHQRTDGCKGWGMNIANAQVLVAKVDEEIVGYATYGRFWSQRRTVNQ